MANEGLKDSAFPLLTVKLSQRQHARGEHTLQCELD